MAEISFIKNNPIIKFVSKAIDIGAYEIEVEYKNGREEIIALKGSVGFGIASLDADSDEASHLRNQLCEIEDKKKTIVRINETEYKLKINTYESFGETVFRLMIEPS